MKNTLVSGSAVGGVVVAFAPIKWSFTCVIEDNVNFELLRNVDGTSHFIWTAQVIESWGDLEGRTISSDLKKKVQ